jgi:hypothetical protein
MKQQLLATFLLVLTLSSIGQQQLPNFGLNQTFLFPNRTNQFITSERVIWALDTEETFSFTNSNKVENENVFNYVANKVVSGKIEAYDLRVPGGGFGALENATFSEGDRFPKRALTKDELGFILLDSLKAIKFHEIFYLDNYSLSCQITAAAPVMRFFTASGINVGSHGLFYCCTTVKDTSHLLQTEGLVHLMSRERMLDFDSIKDAKFIKQNYGLNLAQSIWYGASRGFLRLLDLKTNQFIPPEDVMNYAYGLDSVQMYNQDGTTAGYDVRKLTVFPYTLTDIIQFTQDFFYDVKKDVFTTRISNCFLYVRYWDKKKYANSVAKRFRLLP